MTSKLSRLAARLDTMGARSKMRKFRAGWAGHTAPDLKFYRSPKVQYRYREQGEGQTIVFAVDPPATLEVYDELLEVFSSKFRVIILELPAMGFSAAQSNYGFGWQETNDDLANFLQHIAGHKAVLAFSCVAGLAAVDIAVRHAHLVSRLVLLQTGDVAAFALWKAKRDPKKILARPFIGQYLMKKLAPKRMTDWFQLSVGNKGKLEHFCKCAEQSFQHGALWSLASAYQIYMDPDVKLGKPKQPILAIWGLADGSHPKKNADSPKRLSDNVTYVALPKLGHFPEIEDPKQIFGLVDSFLLEEAKTMNRAFHPETN